MVLNKKNIEICNNEVSKLSKTVDRLEEKLRERNAVINSVPENSQEIVVQTVLKIANFLKFTISSDSFDKVVRFKARHATVSLF